MNKDGKYRYTLQFGADTQENIRVGEFLERLGNRKSHIIVDALTEYLGSHPGLETDKPKIEVKVSAALDRTAVEKLIRMILSENPDLWQRSTQEPSGTGESLPGALAVDVAQMLENIDLFQ